MPAHNHSVTASNQIGTDRTPQGEDLARSKGMNLYGPSGTIAPLAFEAIGVAGSSFPHNNLPPYLAMTFIIAMQGVFPARN
jgi:microcystin-dependent protein